MITTDDRDVTSDDPCLKCRCKKGIMTCSKKACPVLQCPNNKQIHEKGECCPRCREKRAFLPIPDKCLFNHDVYDKKRLYEVDKCTKCRCVNETFVCNRISCPILDCSPDYQQNIVGQCCKKCIMPEELRSQCSFNGITYEVSFDFFFMYSFWNIYDFLQEGESWKLNECSSCTCNKGMPSCAMTICNATQSCPAGTRYVHKPGECCGKCEESNIIIDQNISNKLNVYSFCFVTGEGACMAFGDPHYKTFDGKIYTFEGIGKYLLVSDCHWRSFTVRVANEFSNKNKQQSTITKRVAIKFGIIRINLGQKNRIKVNGERLKNLPYRKDGKLFITRRDDDTHITLENGVKILWDGKSFLEVTVPTKYKNKVCGLCGNFNSDADDDFKMRRGPTVGDENLFQFASSWFMGRNPPKRKLKHCKVRSKFPNGKNMCKYLTSSELFNQCDSKLNYKMYHKTCLMDMCDCPSGKCYCDSLRAYAQECQRLNVSLPSWKKNSYCSADMFSNKPKPTRIVPLQQQIEKLLKQRANNNKTNKGLGLSSIPIN